MSGSSRKDWEVGEIGTESEIERESCSYVNELFSSECDI